MTIRGFFLVILFLGVFLSYAQDDTEENAVVENKNVSDLLEEQKYLDFESNFIMAVQQRAVENYNKAILLLTKCEELMPGNKAVLFELAKNNYDYKRYDDALNYCNRILKTDSENFWVLKLKTKVLLKQNNAIDALVIQELLYKKNRNEATDLLKLYMRLKEYDNGKALLNEVDQKSIFVINEVVYRNFFYNKSSNTDENLEVENENTPKSAIVNNFGGVESVLKQLESFDAGGQTQKILEISQQNIEKYATQPELYWYNGKALNAMGKFNDAVRVLENGLDFVFDNNDLLSLFYEEFIISYSGLKNISKVNYYKELVQKLK